MSKHSTISPFKFLDSYGKNDRNLFFGREKEIEEIYSKVFQSKLLLVYGASGTGKSSIINCGLANKFQDSDWLPIHIRRGGNITISLFQQVQKEAILPVKAENSNSPDTKDIKKALSSVFLDHFKPIYLIFDQFEELFIFGFKDEWLEFIQTINELIDTDLDVRFIFVLRGEYLEFLSEFEEYIPEFFDNRVRVEKMTRKQAEQSIAGPSNFSSIKLENGFEENLLKKLSPEKSQIELTFLQVFLDKIYRNASQNTSEDKELVFTNEQIEKLGQVSDVLAEFVDEQLFKMEDSKAALTVLKSFVSLQGTKTQKTVEEVQQYTRDIGHEISLEKIDTILNEFVNKRILKDKDDNEQYELRHDSLAQKIYEKITHQERELLDVRQFLSYSINEYEKRGTLLKDEDLLYISPIERSLKLDKNTLDFIELSKKKSGKRKKARRVQIIISAIIIFLLISSIVGFVNSNLQKNRAEELAKIAQSESEEAQKQRQIAEEQSAIATRNAAEAKEQADIATIEKRKAELSAKEAQDQREIAIAQQLIANRERERALEARTQAEKSEQEAISQKQIAENEKSRADQLLMLAIARELGVKATHIIDPQLQGLLARQAFLFNQRNGGNAFQPDIYQSLYLGYSRLSKKENTKPHSLAIVEIITESDKVYTAGNDGKLVENNSESSVLNNSEISISAIAEDEGKALIGTIDGALYELNTANSQLKKIEISGNGEIIDCFLLKEKSIVVYESGTVVLMDKNYSVLETLKMKSKIMDADISNQEMWIALQNGTLKTLSTELTQKSEFNLSADDAIRKIKKNGDNSIFIGRESGIIQEVDAISGEILQVLPGHTAAITDITIDSKNRFIASASFDRTVRVWQLDKLFEQPIILSDHDSWVSSITFDEAGDRLYSGSYNGVLNSYPMDPAFFAGEICGFLTRNLSEKEWNEFISKEIEYEETCN